MQAIQLFTLEEMDPVLILKNCLYGHITSKNIDNSPNTSCQFRFSSLLLALPVKVGQRRTRLRTQSLV